MLTAGWRTAAIGAPRGHASSVMALGGKTTCACGATFRDRASWVAHYKLEALLAAPAVAA